MDAMKKKRRDIDENIYIEALLTWVLMDIQNESDGGSFFRMEIELFHIEIFIHDGRRIPSYSHNSFCMSLEYK